MKKSTWRDFTCAIRHTFSEEEKKKLHYFDHQPRSHGSLRLTGLQVEFGNECKKIIFRPGDNKNKKTKKSNCLSWNLLDINTTTGYISGHKDVFSTSFKTWQSKLSERKPTKWIFMTGSELRCRCYVTAYVRLSWRTNETECRDAWQKCLQGLIKQTTAGLSCFKKNRAQSKIIVDRAV